LQAGQKVLVNGASGDVGTFAVQLARALGAKVAGVCSARNAELVSSIGADEVIDYGTEDFTRTGQRYDVVLDISGGHTAFACRRALTRGGTLILVGEPAGRWVQPAGHAFGALAGGAVISQRVVMTQTVGDPPGKQCLATLASFIEDGSVTPVIDRRYSF